ncbi:MULTISPECIES: Hsp70 family protein [Paenarthrobacter]|uniref:Hsp70 family protein n=1 Tax=Paenarthrobacter TaxID=1742992 RepID=UPI001FB30CCE|nr:MULTISPECIES: Hsp70 family protein [Paenarthrobacter]MCW3767781.1 Hsp70 family protein [Paenarthrobacter sp. PAE-2]UOD83409.1 Hsp70 family protein [Paenarthrobacter ureafaciens]WNZ05103.1 Hsp70 family protein [Paenarthrobacter ureafaciens]WOC63282.1 Hsp70 family protein [Paenarthrobacter sp. AT5]
MIVGFDFGTTNSLVSIISGNRVIDVLDEEGRPHPSVVRYEGEEVIVGREARHALEEVGLGVHGSTVRSPKFYLGQETINVGGVDRSPVDIVAEVISHVRTESKRSNRRQVLGELDRAVVTIPVNMNGPRRAALREAFAQAGMSVAQFVHEPLAALYGYLRGAADPQSEMRRLMRRNVLVVDWGGGTLDLTLCRIESGRILQLRNGGTDLVGGDEFDQVIRDEVVTRFSNTHGISGSDKPTREARLRLLQLTERNKIELSERAKVTFYGPSYFPESGTTLQYSLSRQELDGITRPLVAAGVREIESLLETAGMAPAQISLCLVAGGMAAMPSIRSSLHELFGPERVLVPENSGTLVSQGAAWIAHDSQRLVLAKQIELEMSRGSRLPLLSAGTPMPTHNHVRRERFHLYCTDPTDGTAKFSVVAPSELTEQPQASDPRTSLGVVTIKVDKSAPPLTERLEFDVQVDDDLILSVEAKSSQQGSRATASYFDLEFGIGLPGAEDLGSIDAADTSRFVPNDGLVIRANVADEKDSRLIPGDVLYKHKPQAFSRIPGPGQATEEQIQEHLYYMPCAVCKRQWGDPACRCASSVI